jgi:hypothetical protein
LYAITALTRDCLSSRRRLLRGRRPRPGWLDQDLHRPPPLRRDRRPPHLQRHHHRDRHRVLPPRPRQGRRRHVSRLSRPWPQPGAAQRRRHLRPHRRRRRGTSRPPRHLARRRHRRHGPHRPRPNDGCRSACTTPAPTGTAGTRSPGRWPPAPSRPACDSTRNPPSPTADGPTTSDPASRRGHLKCPVSAKSALSHLTRPIDSRRLARDQGSLIQSGPRSLPPS